MRTPTHPEHPGRPTRPGKPAAPDIPAKPATRTQFARLKAILAEDAQSDRSDLVVRLGAEPPSDAVLAAMDEGTRTVVEWVVAHRDEIARRTAGDRVFAALMATDPGAALAQLGLELPDQPEVAGPGTGGPTRPDRARPRRPGTAAQPAVAAGPFASLGGRRFEIPRELIEIDLNDADPPIEQVAAVGLLAETIRGARATASGWTTLRADPPAAVLAASRLFGWTAVGMSPDSAAAASVVQQVSAALAGALQWTGASSSGTTGPGTPTTPGAAVAQRELVDLEIRAGRVRTVRIPTVRTEG